MDEFYQSLFAPGGHRLLGRRLLPFSLWHFAQLDHAKSPLLGHPGEIDLKALRIASCVCVTRFPETLRVRPDGWWETARHDVALRRAALNLVFAKREWRRYLAAQGAPPEMIHYGKGQVRYCSCPPPLAIWSALMVRGNWTEAECWDLPMRRAAWYKVSTAEAEGVEINLMDARRREAYLKAGRGDMLKGAVPA